MSSPTPRPVLPSASRLAGASPSVPHSARTTVRRRVVFVVDRRAPQPARGSSPARPFRVLPTTVWYPTIRSGPHRCPLVVFAHGFDARPQMYSRLLRHVAAAGYVVAAPLFPISGSGLAGSPREDDMANQALDLGAVITAVTSAGRPGHWLSGTLDAGKVAVAGHSDGAETAAASVLVRTDQDPRIAAAVLLAGQLPTWGPIRPSAIPTLVVQGSADTINPPQLSRALYDRLRGPKAYLDVLGANHMQLASAIGEYGRAVQAAFIDFLAAELRGDRTALAELRRGLMTRPGSRAVLRFSAWALG